MSFCAVFLHTIPVFAPQHLVSTCGHLVCVCLSSQRAWVLNLGGIVVNAEDIEITFNSRMDNFAVNIRHLSMQLPPTPRGVRGAATRPRRSRATSPQRGRSRLRSTSRSPPRRMSTSRSPPRRMSTSRSSGSSPANNLASSPFQAVADYIQEVEVYNPILPLAEGEVYGPTSPSYSPTSPSYRPS